MSVADRPIAPAFDPQLQVSLSNGRIVSHPMGVWLSALIMSLPPDVLADVVHKADAIDRHIVRV